MPHFPTATKQTVYQLEGHEGFWRKLPHNEGVKNPDSIRGIIKSANLETLAWFVPLSKEADGQTQNAPNR